MSTATLEAPNEVTAECTIVATVDQATLLNAVGLVKRSLKGSHKELNYVCMEFFPDQTADLWAMGKNGWFKTSIDCATVDVRGGGATAIQVDMSRFSALLREMPRGELMLSVEYGEKTRLVIASNGFEYTLSCSETWIDRPNLPEENRTVAASIPLVELNRIRPFLLPFVSRDRLRPAMMNVCIDPADDGAAFVSTDGHRLGVDRVLSEDAGIYAQTALSPLFLSILPRLRSDTVDILHAGGKVFYRCGKTLIDCGISVENYPDWRAVLPKADAGRARFEAKPFIEAMRRIMAVAPRMTSQITMTVNGELAVAVENLDYDISGREVIDAEVSDFDIKIGFNGWYLIDVIRSIGDKVVTLDFTGPNRAAIVRGTDSQRYCLIMPVMLSTYA